MPYDMIVSVPASEDKNEKNRGIFKVVVRFQNEKQADNHAEDCYERTPLGYVIPKGFTSDDCCEPYSQCKDKNVVINLDLTKHPPTIVEMKPGDLLTNKDEE
jgi:hypothetical protein